MRFRQELPGRFVLLPVALGFGLVVGFAYTTFSFGNQFQKMGPVDATVALVLVGVALFLVLRHQRAARATGTEVPDEAKRD